MVEIVRRDRFPSNWIFDASFVIYVNESSLILGLRNNYEFYVAVAFLCYYTYERHSRATEFCWAALFQFQHSI